MRKLFLNEGPVTSVEQFAANIERNHELARQTRLELLAAITVAAMVVIVIVVVIALAWRRRAEIGDRVVYILSRFYKAKRAVGAHATGFGERVRRAADE